MIRINKYLASIGVASRRKIDEMIDAKRILVNGQAAKAGLKVDPQTDQIVLDGKKIEASSQQLKYIILNKPERVLSTVSDEHGRKTVLDLVKVPERIYPVGRLDYDTTGLILLTNDGDLAYRITHPKHHFPKAYLLTVTQIPSKPQLELFRSGVPLEDGITSKTDIQIFHTTPRQTIIKVTLYEGKNRQIRRMCETVGLDLIALKRISIGPIQLANLQEGESRNLTPEEVASLKEL